MRKNSGLQIHVCIYDYLGGHGDFLRFIFVRAIEKLYWQANFGISQVSLYIYFIYKQTGLQIGNMIATINECFYKLKES